MSKFALSSVIPAFLEVRFQFKKCNGSPSASFAKYYSKFFDANEFFEEELIGVPLSTKIIYSKVLAIWNGSDSNPKNKDVLDDLAEQISKDYCNWLKVSFDESYNQIIAPKLDALTDHIEFIYRPEQILSRRYTSPYVGGLERNFSHDPEDPGCVGDTSDTEIEFLTPCFESYGPPIAGGGASYTLYLYKNCFIGGQLVQTFLKTESVACGCGCDPNQTYVDFTVFGCTGIFLEAAEIELELDGVVVFTGVTGSDGKLRVGISQPGTYDWSVTKHILGTKRYTTSSGTLTFACNDKKTQLTSVSSMPGFVCCSDGGGNQVEYPYSENMLVTYSGGSVIITWDSVQSAWIQADNLTFHDDIVTTCPPETPLCEEPTTSGDVYFRYRMFCTPPYDFVALWGVLDCFTGTNNILAGCDFGTSASPASSGGIWNAGEDFPQNFTFPATDSFFGVNAPYPGLVTVSEILP